MPVFRSGPGQAPAWCELEYFEILRLPPGESRDLSWRGKKEKLFVGQGRCVLEIAGSEHFLIEGEHMNLPLSTEPLHLTVVNVPTILIRVTGRWGDETGGCGVGDQWRNCEIRSSA